MKKIFISIGALLVLALAGCSSDTNDMGIVARVNNRPIYLTQLEFQHDLLHMDASGGYIPSVEGLRAEYGRILADLIVLELVAQELERQDLEVTDEELLVEENKIRADYPDGAFEQVLIEEYIDLNSWREQLKYHTSLNKFFQQVLRPQIKIDYTEAEEYYKAHIKDFKLPETLKLLVIRGPRRNLVDKSLKLYGDGKKLAVIMREAAGISIREITVLTKNVATAWQGALENLEPGEESDVMETQFGFEALVLIDRTPAKLLDPSQAYPLVEDALIQRKMKVEFNNWLEDQMVNSKILISQHLIPGDEPLDVTPLVGIDENSAGEGLQAPAGFPGGEIDDGEMMGSEDDNETF